MTFQTPKNNRNMLSKLSASQRLRVGELVDAYELAQDEGVLLTPEQLCVHEPELLEALISSIGRLAATDRWLGMTGSAGYPKRIGEFEALEEIGVGGSGVVLRCQQKNPDRQIAVKILKPTSDATEQRKRFRRELDVFSALTVPGIAEVYVTGVTEWNGAECFWIAMELLEGGRIDDYVKREQLSQRAILELFRDICRTMQSAHRQGIIHRDLKPSNILVSAAGVAHVVDFGIAAITKPDHSVATETHSPVMGTVAWMAPEVVLGTSTKADTRSDIYSLGTVLFQLLTGQHPLNANRLTLPQVTQRLMAGPSPKLSSSMSGVSKDLDTFASRLIDRDPAYRYQNLDNVLADLDRILAGDPISVRSITLAERAWRWCRKNTLLTIASAVAIVGVAAAMIIFVLSAYSIRDYADQLVQTNAELQHSLERRERTIVNVRLGNLARHLYDNPRETEQRLNDSSQFPPEMRSFGWELLSYQSRTDFRRLQCAETTIRSLQFSHDDRLLASKSVDGKLQITDVESSNQMWEVDGTVKTRHSPLKFSPDDRFLYSIGKDSGIRVHDVVSGKLLETLLPDVNCQSPLLDLSEDGRWLITASEDNRLLLLDLNSGHTHERDLGPDVKIVALWLQTAGQILGGMTTDGISKSWLVPSLNPQPDKDMKALHWGFADIKSGTASLRMADGAAHAVISRNADVLVVRSDAVPKPIVQQFSMDVERIDALSLLPPHSALVTGGNYSRIFDLYSGATKIFRDSGRTPCSNAVSTTGEQIAIGNTDGSVGIYRINIPSPRHTVEATGRLLLDNGAPVCTASTRDGRYIFSGHEAGSLVKFNLRAKRPVSVTRVTSKRISSLVLAPDEDWIACGANGAADENGIYVYECGADITEATLIEPHSLQQLIKISTSRVCAMALLDDGRRLLAGHRNGEISVVDTATWTIIQQWQAHPDSIFALAAAHRIVVSADTLGTVKVWHQDTFEPQHKPQHEWQAHDKRISDIAIDPAGGRIFTTSHDRTAAIWKPEGELIRRLTGHTTAVRAVAVSPDGLTLATAGEDYLIHLWDAQTGDPQFVLSGHNNTVQGLLFTPLGLVSTSHDMTLSVWGAPKVPH